MDRSVSVRFEFSNVVFLHNWNCLNVQNTPGKTTIIVNALTRFNVSACSNTMKVHGPR